MLNPLTRAPWRWQTLGGKLVLVAAHGRRDIILTDCEALGLVTRDPATGILEPVSTKYPNIRAMGALPDLVDVLTVRIAGGSPPAKHLRTIAEMLINLGHRHEAEDLEEIALRMEAALEKALGQEVAIAEAPPADDQDVCARCGNPADSIAPYCCQTCWDAEERRSYEAERDAEAADEAAAEDERSRLDDYLDALAERSEERL